VPYFGDGRVSNARHAAADTDWAWPGTGLVSATWRTCLRRTARSSLPSITCIGRRTASVENRHHNADTEERHAGAPERDIRPISITPVLSRSLERFVVRKFIYSALSQPYPSLDFSDQFALRPTGSTTASIVAMLHAVRSVSNDYDYVHVFSFDFSKAFDTVRHASLMSEL